MAIDSEVRVRGDFLAKEAVRKAIEDGMGDDLKGAWWKVRARESKTDNAITVTITDNSGFKWKKRFTGDPAKPGVILETIRQEVASAVADQPRQTI